MEQVNNDSLSNIFSFQNKRERLVENIGAINDYDDDDDIAIIGIGLRLPSGDLIKSNDSPTVLWNNLVRGFDGIIKTTSRWSDNFNELGEISNVNGGLLPFDEWKSFDPLFFGINPSEASMIDPQQRLLLKCTWEALEDSNIDPISIRGSKTSVFIGCSSVEYKELNKNQNQFFPNIFGSTLNTISNRISHCFDFRGESITIDTACSSSLNAVRLGYQSIKTGCSSLSIVGGVNLIIDTTISKSFTYLNMLSKSGKCMSFDANADGFVRSEGCGVFILKSLKQSIIDGNNIYCVIKGSSSNVDGNGLQDKQNFYSPSSTSQADNIKTALLSTNGSVKLEDIVYIEAHGTGTPTGDPIELEGISRVFNNINNNNNNNNNRNNNIYNQSKKKPLLVGSIKSSVGHLEAASGSASLLKCCLMFKHQCLTPNINFSTPNPSIKFDEWNLKVVTEPMQFSEVKKTNNFSMIINNFGITGSNCCLVLSQYNGNNKNEQQQPKQQLQQQQQQPKQYLIPFSANSIQSLKRYESTINSDEFKALNDFNEFVKQQIFSKSTSLYQRLVVTASCWNDFSENIQSSTNKIQTSNSKSSNISIVNKNPIIVFVFAGQGSQYNTMALELYSHEPIFKESMDKLNNKLSNYFGYSVLDKLRSIEDGDKSIHHPMIAPPAMCMLMISLFELYKHWGIEASFIVGHSLGEIPAAYCSGMISLDTLCYLIYHRSRALIQTHYNGRMLSVNISPEEYISNYLSKYPNIEIACYNSPTSIVLGGSEQKLNQISNELKDKGIFSAMLGSLSSFHTSIQSITKDQILNLNIESQSPKIPIFSTVTTNLYNDTTTLFNSEYVFNNIIKPVKFSQTISNLYKHIEINKLGNEIVFIELAPHPTLQFYLKQMIPTKQSDTSNLKVISTYSPLHKKKNDIQEIQKTISQLYCDSRYNNINFKSQFKNEYKMNRKQSSILPNYQWDDDEKYWKEDSIQQNHRIQGPPMDQLGLSLIESSPNVKSYQSFIDIGRKSFQYLKGHIVGGKYYFPGCGYIDNILKIYSSQDFTIGSMEFKSPLVLMDGVNKCLQTNIYQTGKTEYKAEFHFKDNKSNEWVQSSIAHFQLFNNNGKTLTKKYNIQEIIEKQCNLTKLSKNELYQHIKSKTALSYNGEFQGVLECYLGDDCSLATIPITIKSPSTPLFSPSVLDTCLHSSVGLVDEQCQLVFERFEGFKYYSSNLQSLPTSSNQIKLYSFSNNFKRIGDSFTSSIIVMFEDGRVLFEINNLICKSLTTIKDSLKIEPPLKDLYSTYIQSIDSPILPPSNSTHQKSNEPHQIKNNDKVKNYNISILNKFISNQFYSNIIKRCPQFDIETIKSMNINQLKQRYLHHLNNDDKYSKLFQFVIETIVSYGINDYQNDCINFNESNIENYEILLKSTSIIAKLLFPLKEDSKNSIDEPHSLFDNGMLENFYSSHHILYHNEVIGNIIYDSLLPIVNEKMVFRILEFGGGVGSLSLVVLNKINELLGKFPNSEIDIEYTWSDISASFIADVKSKFSHINKKVHIIYKSLDLEKPLIHKQQQQQQMLKPSYYDFVIMSNILHCVKEIIPVLNQIYEILKPNGQMVFLEPIYKSVIFDSIFGVFDQWWSFTDLDIRKDRCCMPIESWNQLLLNCQFIDNKIIMSNETPSFYVIQTQKPSFSNLKVFNLIDSSVDSIIIYGNDDSELFNHSLKERKAITNIKEFNELIKSSTITDKSTIYFTKTINQLTIDNFKSVTLEYIQINQQLLSSNLKCKHVLVTLNSDNINYLSASVMGAFRYFDEFHQLNLFSLDFDQKSIDNIKLNNSIQLLLDTNKFIQKEFIIRDGKVFYERYKKNSNLKNIFKSESFENEKNQLFTKLSPNLEYILNSKKSLKDGELEVEVKATGVNYKDYLIYSGLVPPESINRNGDINNPEFGIEFSGIVSRVGDNVNNNFKIGDQVYGIGHDTISTHVIVDSSGCYHKPTNISHTEAASIPAVYLTSYHSIFNIGCLNIKRNESILIHSGTGGVGLSALNILKWKGHKSHVFVTVGSKEKEKYILDTYGDFITGIYSTRNKDYVEEIKLKLKEFGSNKKGVDLILNTLSSDYMDSNFKCLNTGGRIVDLSITHLNHNEYINNNNFKFNFGYHNVELNLIGKLLIGKMLKKITIAIENGELNLMPITEFSNSKVKEAIEYINQRKHIGKIIVNNDTDVLGDLFFVHQNQRNSNFSILKENYKINQDHLGSTVLVTGQSGIILEVLKWIVKFSENLKNIIVLSKSSMKWGLELLINRNKHINFHFKRVDISSSNDIDNAIEQIFNENSTIINVDSIFHFAIEYITCNVNDIDMNSLEISHGAKTIGAINLHNQSIKRNWKLKQFILSSSVASILGSPDQCSYVCSNRVLDSFSKYRKSIGLPSICTNYGSVQSAGLVSRNESIAQLLDGQGLDILPINMILGSLDSQIQNVGQSTNLMVSPFNFNTIYENLKKYSMIHKFDFITNLLKNNKSTDSYTKGESIDTLFLKKASEILSIDINRINQDLKLVEYGSDSLSIVQLKNWIDKEFYPNLITIKQLQTNSISSSIKIITDQLVTLKLSDNSSIIQRPKDNIPSNKTIESDEFWKNEIKLDDKFSELAPTHQIKENKKVEDDCEEKRIFLTGSTGFLGAYLLWHLLQMESCTVIYCLLRNKSESKNPVDEILNNLKHHQLYDKKLNENNLSKIVPIVGDLTKKKFGLSDNDYSLISNDTNLLINSGADINLRSNYHESKQVNINSVKEVIKLSLFGKAKQHYKPKPIITISTFSVFYNQKLDQEFDESTVTPKLETINDLPTGYMQSKVVSEIILTQASSKFKIPSIILRAPSIFSNPDTGIGHSGDIIQLMLQSSYKLGYFPSDEEIDISMMYSPVTWVAENIIKIIMFNIDNNKELSTSSKLLSIYSVYGEVLQFVKILQTLKCEQGGNCKEIDFKQWKKMVMGSKERACVKLRNFHTLDFDGGYNFEKGYSISNKQKSFLESLGTYGNGGIVTDQMIFNHIHSNN
ncbi:hypothetical protein RB653_010317 [Dictyostelium firmibasis]|uniref:Uncharacterized protein n=1 Tax=Dictyostelium firmibasis TaxID=79012 RepID=A0AAN7YTK1_9MYCE